MLSIISENEQMTTKDMRRTGNGGAGKIVAIRHDQYEIITQDDNLITDRDRRINQLNQRDGRGMVHPTLGECVERIIEIYINLPPQYKRLR